MELYDNTPPDTPNICKVGSVGWAAVFAGALIFDALAGETLSHAFRRHKPYSSILLCYTGAHLMGWLPEELDAFKSLTKL